MKNLSGKANYLNLIKQGKSGEIIETTESVELDPKAVQEVIENYHNLVEKCEKLYELKPNKHLGDLFISLSTLKTVIEKI